MRVQNHKLQESYEQKSLQTKKISISSSSTSTTTTKVVKNPKEAENHRSEPKERRKKEKIPSIPGKIDQVRVGEISKKITKNISNNRFGANRKP